MEPSEALKATLRPYQKRALWWMLQRENRELTKKSEVSSSFLDLNPLYDQFSFAKRKGIPGPDFYYNKYTGKIRITRPVPPTRSRGGILAGNTF